MADDDENSIILPLSHCVAKHTKFQPTSAQWYCPSCGADSSNFIVEDIAENAHSACEALHQEDAVWCSACQKGGSGNKIANQMAKKLKLKPCPCCKGHGFVPDDA